MPSLINPLHTFKHTFKTFTIHPTLSNLKTIATVPLRSVSKITLFFTFMMTLTYGQQSFANSTAVEALQLTSQQSMLSQRIAKAFIFVSLSDDQRKAKQLLDRSIEEFEDNLNKMRSNSIIISYSPNLDKVNQIWSLYRSQLDLFSNKEVGKKVLLLSDDLLKETTLINEAILSKHKSSIAHGDLMNLSAQQAMHSQRVAKLSFAYNWGIVGKNSAQQEINQTLSSMNRALNVLQQSQYSNANIKGSLGKVQTQSKFAEKSIKMTFKGKNVAYVIESTTDTMLSEIDNITKMYADLSS